MDFLSIFEQPVLISLLQVTQLANMLDSLLMKELQDADELEAIFIQCLTWSIGAGLLEDGRIKFDAQLKTLAAMSNVTDDDKTLAGLGKNLTWIHLS